ncbi:MAG TPA: radical SAM family heme chaperone HemW [Treponemataceae bacterium]|nr:radical SAM family heme chaperone HemW [Treponemataceae bacterium]
MCTASLYIHIPFCTRKCTYCDFFSVPSPNNLESSLLPGFIASISDELDSRFSVFNIQNVKSLYIGGGTPSLLSADTIEKLAQAIRTHIPSGISSDIEWTIEANPEDLSPGWLDACARSGINRISTGIQTLSVQSFDAIGRRGSVQQNLKALELLSQYWQKPYSVDLISGLPFQTQKTLLSDISTVSSYSPHHISLYALTLEQGTQMAQQVLSGAIEIPKDEDADLLWINGRDRLENTGYMQYEVSNFSKPGYECVHNMTYWNLESYIGIGPGATGSITREDTATRYTNTCDIEEWMHNPGSTESETIDRNSFMLENLMMGFRKKQGLSLTEFKKRFSCDLESIIPRTLAKWTESGHAHIEQDSVMLTRDGLLLLNKFLSDCLSELD